jgi:hypothetical protein
MLILFSWDCQYLRKLSRNFCVFVFQEFVLADRRAKGEDVTKEPEMRMVYNDSRDGLSRKARKGEEPNVKFEPGIGTPKSPELYATVQRG